MNDLSSILTGNILERDSLVRIGDLIYTDGPLLTLFQSKVDKNFYLFDYADRDGNANRWIIYNVSAGSLFDYLTKKINHKELFQAAIGGLYYYSDINPSKLPEYKIRGLRGLPAKYCKVEDSFFDEEFCTEPDYILLHVSRAKAIMQSNKFYGAGFEIKVVGLIDRGLTAIIRTKSADDQVIVPDSYDENIKTGQAHVRQTYQLPTMEAMEIFGAE